MIRVLLRRGHLDTNTKKGKTQEKGCHPQAKGIDLRRNGCGQFDNSNFLWGNSFCCLNQPACAALLWQPLQTQTRYNGDPSPGMTNSEALVGPFSVPWKGSAIDMGGNQAGATWVMCTVIKWDGREGEKGEGQERLPIWGEDWVGKRSLGKMQMGRGKGRGHSRPQDCWFYWILEPPSLLSGWTFGQLSTHVDTELRNVGPDWV